jgi:uncharacterized membrane protein YgcG
MVINPSTPSTLYVSIDGGDVYESTDSGANWSAKGFDQISFDIYALAVDSATPGTLYVGNHSGVFKSSDDGATWSQINTGLTNTIIRALVVDPATPGALYAGSVGSGVFKYSADSSSSSTGSSGSSSSSGSGSSSSSGGGGVMSSIGLMVLFVWAIYFRRFNQVMASKRRLMPGVSW